MLLGPFGTKTLPGDTPGTMPEREPKNHETITFRRPLFGPGLKQFWVFSRSLVLQRFLKFVFAGFVLPGLLKTSNFEALLIQNATLFNETSKN